MKSAVMVEGQGLGSNGQILLLIPDGQREFLNSHYLEWVFDI